MIDLFQLFKKLWKRINAPNNMTPTEAAEIIEGSCNGTENPYVFEDFLSLNYANPLVQQARDECHKIIGTTKSPPNPHFLDDLRDVAKRLRSKINDL